MAVMVVTHLVLGFPWGPGFVLGSVLGPTDTVAAAAILERFNLPRDLLAVIRGESLLNDALALVLYETAVHLTQTRSFVWGSISGGFCVAVAGGILIGLGLGWLMLRVRSFTGDPLAENTISLLTAYAAYLTADAVHVSGVLAVVAAGLYIGWKDPRMLSAKSRLQSVATWETITFPLNGLLFILIGLQLRGIIESLSGGSVRSILRASFLVSATVILVRILLVFVRTYLPLVVSRRLRQRTPFPPWQEPALISWVWDARRYLPGCGLGDSAHAFRWLALRSTRRNSDRDVCSDSGDSCDSRTEPTAFASPIETDRCGRGTG